ncbi:hypothetical protein ACIPVK_08360 [Paeniglutamicibacter sp. MACA_103]|uniref:hypothetical protein n=1 Tax=Paeniglutamicibacter sp. MACA_103 TaxID=3377337 RepID=UPI0038943BD5
MSAEIPVAVRATSVWATSRWLRRPYRHFRFDVRFADGREEPVESLDAVLQGSRYPADASSTRKGAEQACPKEGIGEWVDYPYGQPLGR